MSKTVSQNVGRSAILRLLAPLVRIQLGAPPAVHFGMINLTPFLLFDGNCAEAMSFYQSCLGGELKIVTVGETLMMERVAPDQHRKVAHAHFKNDAIECAATDWPH